MNATATRRRVVVDNSALAADIGSRIRRARLNAGLTQQKLAGDRYTKAYVSALENGLAKPSMAALTYLTERLGTTPAALLADRTQAWHRLEADLHLAAGDWGSALDGYLGLLDGAPDRTGRAELLLGTAEALCRLDRPGDAIAPATEAAASFEALGRAEDRARAEYWLASAQNQVDNPDEARAILRGTLDRIRGGLALDPDFRARVLIALAMVEVHQGEASAALGYLEEARALIAELDDRRRGIFMTSLAHGYREAGDLEAAIRVGLQGLGLLRSAQAHLDAGYLENQLALAYLAAGNAGRAREIVRDARAGAGARGDDRLAAHLADTDAMVALQSGTPDAALALADEAIRLAEGAENEKGLLDALATRARALSALGRHAEAATSFERAAELARDHAPASRRREILSAWADVLAALGRHDEAYALAREALAAR
jgi:transcriptional regulator with XRE-family HTH domain